MRYDKENMVLNPMVLGPRKPPRSADPLVHYGRNFGRTIHAMCNVSSVLRAGVMRASNPEHPQDADQAYLYSMMIRTIPGLEARLFEQSNVADDLELVASLIQKGMAQARSDDTKSMKGPIIDWITTPGENLKPPLPRNSKSLRGFHHNTTGFLLCPIGTDWKDESIRRKLASGEIIVPADNWPIFLYAGFKYDHENPWNGLLRSNLLVTAFKHVFTSPSSVEKEFKATRSGNARIHGMKRVTIGSIAYIATQVRFALSSMGTFTRVDGGNDSEFFFNSILGYLQHPDEKVEVEELLSWWNKRVFPGWDFDPRPLASSGALSRIRMLREQRKAAQGAGHDDPGASQP